MTGGRFPFRRAEPDPQPEQQQPRLAQSPSLLNTELVVPDPAVLDLIADLAIEFWRMERRMGRVVEKIGPDSLAPLMDSLRRVDTAMQQHGLERRPHDGELAIDGVGFEILHVREVATPLVVVETIQPTVVFGDRVIRHGKVVVGAGIEGTSR